MLKKIVLVLVTLTLVSCVSNENREEYKYPAQKRGQKKMTLEQKDKLRQLHQVTRKELSQVYQQLKIVKHEFYMEITSRPMSDEQFEAWQQKIEKLNRKKLRVIRKLFRESRKIMGVQKLRSITEDRYESLLELRDFSQ